jgi:hypothetical protein
MPKGDDPRSSGLQNLWTAPKPTAIRLGGQRGTHEPLVRLRRGVRHVSWPRAGCGMPQPASSDRERQPDRGTIV